MRGAVFVRRGGVALLCGVALSLALLGCGDDGGGGGAASGDGGGGNDGPRPERDVIQVAAPLKAEFVGAGPPSVCDWGDGRVVINLRIRDRTDREDSRVVLPNAETVDGVRMDELFNDGFISLDEDTSLVEPRFDGSVCGEAGAECPDGYTCANTRLCERPASFSVVPGSVRFVPSRVSFIGLSVALLIDESAAIGVGDGAQDAAGDRHFAARAFLESLSERFPAVEVGLYTFGGEGTAGVEQVIDFTQDTTFVAGTLDSLEASDGGRPLFDAMDTAATDLAADGRSNSILVVVTGGPDTSSALKIRDMDDRLADVPVFVVHLGGVQTENGTLPDDELIRLSCRLGGNYYYELQTDDLRKSTVLVADIIDGVWQVELEAAGLRIDPKAFTTLSATMRLSSPGLNFNQVLEFEGGGAGNFGNRLFIPYR